MIDVYKHPTEDRIRVVFTPNPDGTTEPDVVVEYDPGFVNADEEVGDVPGDWVKLTPDEN